MAKKYAILRRDFVKAGILGSAGMATTPLAAAPPSAVPTADGMDGALRQGFATPPSAAKPHTLWHWMDGNVTKAGITADLEAMKRIGLGGAMIYNLSDMIPPGPVQYASPKWRRMIRHAAAEANRLGLEIGMHNASGWSSTGGPWITPDLAMQKLVWSEKRVHGPLQFAEALPRPEAGDYDTYYHDIAVLACRTPAAERESLREADATISTSLPGDTPRKFNRLTAPLNLSFPTPTQEAQYVQLAFGRPFLAQDLLLDFTSGHGPVTCTLQFSNDGKIYKTAASVVLPRRGMTNINFPPVTARWYRLAFTSTPQDHIPHVVNSIDLLGGYRLPDWAVKAGFVIKSEFAPCWDATCPDELRYHRRDIIDVSARMRADGRLEWNVPAGEWTILRFGYAPSGARSVHPERGGDGLEVDKMNPTALDTHFTGLLDAVLNEMGPLAGKSFVTLLVDSYEVGPQNWTGRFREEFHRRQGYDIVPFLPALTGRIVDAPETSERVLWDLRQTISALFTENYYGHFRHRCRERNLRFAAEPYIGPFGIIDGGSAADIAIGEFWAGGFYPENKAISRRVIASAHLNGRAIAGAEAFTSRFETDRFSLDPAALKADGDAQFCEGVTRFYFHRFAHQPWLDKAPGMTMGPWGLHFDRTETWWEPGRAWIAYITRCQYLLQTGKPVADILCFDGEDGPATSQWQGAALPDIPAGYDYDFVNADFLLSAKVANGAIELANGVRYRVLALPDARHLSLSLARKLMALVAAGAVIVGPPPLRTPGFVRHTENDRELRRIVTALWGECDGKTVTYHRAGKGTVYWGKTLAEVMAEQDIPSDFTSPNAPPVLRFKHRALPQGEIYFVSNQSKKEATAMCRFRIDGMMPELWHPDTGRCEPAPQYSHANGATHVSLKLPPSGSVFVVFRKRTMRDHAVAVSANLAPDRIERTNGGFTVEGWTAGRYEVTTANGRVLHADMAAPPAPIDISDTWKVAFPPQSGAPKAIMLDRLASLSSHATDGVRYFSGTATYTRGLYIPAEMLSTDYEVYLDLGEVKNLARVLINHVDVGILWTPPFRLAIGAALRRGGNLIEVCVTNLWANRLIGDDRLPDDCDWVPVSDNGMRLKEWPAWLKENKPRPSKRQTFVTWKFYDKDAPLPASGLIGPVVVRIARKAYLKG